MTSHPNNDLADEAGQRQSYTPGFFANIAPGSMDSARLFLKMLFEVYQPRSVIDIGCGKGTWLTAAEELGASKLAGLDGPWVDPATFPSRNIHFRATDLESDFDPGERFDLCISVEVAEHLSPKAARRFVEKLCSASDIVLFSAAIKNQGGVMHLNEQPQSYWARMFDECGYECHDLFRPAFWANHRIQNWYRQNALLYVNRSHPITTKLRARTLLPGPLDIVHPEIYEGNLETYKRAVDEPTLRFCWQMLGKWSKRQFRKVFSG